MQLRDRIQGIRRVTARTSSKKRPLSGAAPSFGQDDARALSVDDCPDHLSDVGKMEWARLIADRNPPGRPPRLLVSNRVIACQWCDHWSDYVAARKALDGKLILKSEGAVYENTLLAISRRTAQQMRLLGVEMGLTPASRPRMEPPAVEPKLPPDPRGGSVDKTAEAPSPPAEDFFQGLRVYG
jgi:P27 family predicted phage terminase small subunit